MVQLAICATEYRLGDHLIFQREVPTFMRRSLYVRLTT
jgi:hypothetical protein